MTESTDESLAKALGIEECACFGWPAGSCHRANGDHFDSGNDDGLPIWSESFDACLRDIVPVLRARGMYEVLTDISKMIAANGQEWHVRIAKLGSGEFVAGSTNVSLPAAFCEAALKALEATNG